MRFLDAGPMAAKFTGNLPVIAASVDGLIITASNLLYSTLAGVVVPSVIFHRPR
ncbi:hypothetical protein U1D46_003098 [Cronobacter dublinensis]|nr:hypothetical protein [Cronobacter dublinensis]